MILTSDRVDIVLQSVEETLARVDALAPEVRKEVSPVWLELVKSVRVASPWIHWFSIVKRDIGQEIGSCGFKGPPDDAGVVEVAYGIELSFQGKGFATEAVAALRNFAFGHNSVLVVRAHTLPNGTASQRVLSKCGFHLVGEVEDPEDGKVLRWEVSKSGD